MRFSSSHDSFKLNFCATQNTFWKKGSHMRYLLPIFLFFPYIHCLERSLSKRHFTTNTHVRYIQETPLSPAEKNTHQIQLDDIGSALIKALKECAHSDQIQIHLNNWDNLKTYGVTITTGQIDEILVTARTIEEIMRDSVRNQSKAMGLRSSQKVQFMRDATSDSSFTMQQYINAQLNYDKICNHLGIKK